MGSPESEPGRYSDELLHKVKLSPYHIAATPTTFYQYALYCEAEDKSIASKTPSWGRFGSHPLVNVSWYEAVGFCNWLSGQFGLRACLEVVIWAANVRFWNLISAISSPIALLWPRK